MVVLSRVGGLSLFCGREAQNCGRGGGPGVATACEASRPWRLGRED